MPSVVAASDLHPQKLAHALLQARTSGELLNADDWQSVVQSPADVQAVLAATAPAWGWRAPGVAGQVPRYWKSGAPRRGAPLSHAALPEPGIWASPSLMAGMRLHLRGIEAEVALRLGQEVSAEQAADLQPGEGVAYLDAVAVAIEVVETRWQQQLKAPPLLLQADGLCHGALVLGPWQPVSQVQDRDWSAQVCRMQVGAQAEQQFVGTHPLGDPLWLLAGWLQDLSALYGSVPAGTVVTTGSWNGLARAQAGDAIWVDMPGLGRVELQL